jgi:predicted DNA-binding transcriptional regulator AlpA
MVAVDPTIPPPLLVREKSLPALVGISRAGIRRLLAAGRFPLPIRLGRHCVCWRRVDLEAWVEGGCGRTDDARGVGGRR